MAAGGSTFAENGDSGDAPSPRKPARINYLDWLRVVTIVFVVYAHISRMGISGGVPGDVLADDRPWGKLQRAPLGARWLSVARQWCLPLLFWVSGAAMALSFNGQAERVWQQISKLLLYTAVGMSINAALWFLGPQDPMCDPSAETRAKCAGRGVVFDFTICPWAGAGLAIVFQMWYTAVLAVLTLLNWPLFDFVAAEGPRRPEGRRLLLLGGQWALCSLLYFLLIWGGHRDVPRPAALYVIVVLLEAAFLSISALCTPAYRPSWIPLRALHYLAGCIVFLQFGVAPFTDEITSINLAFTLYIFVGFNKFFALGFLMLRCRRGDPKHDAVPLASTWWPVVVLAMVLLSPSTSWYLGGNLTYPFFPGALDRALYVAGAVVVVFVLDRVGRDLVQCQELPPSLAWTAMLLYLTHPACIALLLLLFRLEDVGLMFLICIGASILAGLGLSYLTAWRGKKSAAEAGSSEAVRLRMGEGDEEEDEEDA